MGPLRDLVDAVNGARSAVEHGGALVGDVVRGDVHKAVTDARALMGDAGDVLKGLSGLGVGLGPVPGLYAGSPFGKLSDSEILSKAQLVIEGERKLTGSGEPEDAQGYRRSSMRLDSSDSGRTGAALGYLVDAAPHSDRWDGTAAEAYGEANDAHRRRTSGVASADGDVATIIGTEAGQVSRTRKTLDDASQQLYDYGLATSWMSYVPELNLAKRGLDLAAAAAALATTTTTMGILVKNVAENAWRLRSHVNAYEDAAGHKLEPVMDHGIPAVGAAFVPQRDDLDGRPSRVDPDKPSNGWPEPERPRGNPPVAPLPPAPIGEQPSRPLPAPAPGGGGR